MTTTLPAVLAPPRARPAAAAHLSPEQVEELGRELDELRASVVATLGAADAAYIRRLVAVQRSLELGGRAALVFGRRRSAQAAGTVMLAVAKILENMEIGHNVLHGQWDWMRDPDVHSTTWEWDFVTPAKAWQHTHNDLHHTWTNVVGRDRDVGYTILRVDAAQPWRPWNVGNVVYNALLAPVFEYGIAIYDLELDRVRAKTKTRQELAADLKALGAKVARQAGKDYVATPLAAALTGSGRRALAGTLAANALRSVWAHAVIFCGHFPQGVDTFTPEQVEGETRGEWYVRQILGSANISGPRLLHVLSGHLSFQVEHHLFPDLPSNRYPEVAVRVREICARYGLPYHVGSLPRQVGSTWAKLARLSPPGRRRGRRAVRGGATPIRAH